MPQRSSFNLSPTLSRASGIAAVVSSSRSLARAPSPDPSIAGAYHSGNLVGGANYPTCNNTTPYDNAFSCVSVPVRDNTDTYSVQTSLYIINQAACTAS